MKGYITNNKCYIFPQEAGQIPEVEASVFYVQQEDYVAWIEENESLADKISPYNYNVMTVQPKVWANHENDDLEPAQKEDPELAWSAESASAQIGETNTFPTLTNPHSVTVSYSSSDSEKATIDASTGEITLVAEGDTTISAAFAGDDTYEAQTVIYTLTVQAAAPTTYTITYINDSTEYIAHDAVTSAAEGDTVTVYLKDTSTLEPVGGQYAPYGGAYIDGEWEELVISQTDTFTYQFTMLGGNVEFDVQYTPQIYNITKTGESAEYADVNDGIGPGESYDSAGAGTTVYVYPADENYTFDKACTEPGVTILDVTSSDVTLVYPVDAHYQLNDNYTFVMPSSDISITVSAYTPQQ